MSPSTNLNWIIWASNIKGIKVKEVRPVLHSKIRAPIRLKIIFVAIIIMWGTNSLKKSYRVLQLWVIYDVIFSGLLSWSSNQLTDILYTLFKASILMSYTTFFPKIPKKYMLKDLQIVLKTLTAKAIKNHMFTLFMLSG